MLSCTPRERSLLACGFRGGSREVDLEVKCRSRPGVFSSAPSTVFTGCEALDKLLSFSQPW